MRLHISPLEMINSAIKLKIVRHLILHESPMSEREIASVINVSHMSVNRALKELAQYNIVSYSVAGKMHLWKANKKSYGYAILSELIKSTSLLESPIDHFKKTIQNTLPAGLVEKVVLYGSVAKGQEEPDSDIDLFILVKNNSIKEKIQSDVDTLSNKCLDAYGNRLEAYILTEHEFEQKKALSVIREVEKGIQILP